MKESSVQQRIRLIAARMNIELWRNNIGACTDETGRVIRYGLGNDSAALNEQIKSSDLIGLMPVLITPEMVGTIIGRFVAVECKESNWKMLPSDKCAKAQERWHEIVRKSGGIAGFAISEFDFVELIGKP